MDEIARMVKAARGRIAIMPGGGVNSENIAAIASATGAGEFHSSARTAVPSRMSFRKPGMAMGHLHDREFQNYVVREESVRALVQALASVPAGAVEAHAD